MNISNALTLHLPKDLHLVGNQANIALTIFFVPYILFEIPSNIIMKKLKPHVWRASRLIRPHFYYQILTCYSIWMLAGVRHCDALSRLWSVILALRICLCSHTTVTSFSGLLATRFFLGLAEAGVFPGSKYPLWTKADTSR